MFETLTQSVWISRIGWVLIHTLWQFALVAAAAFVLQRILQRRSAAVQYCVLLSAMAVMVATPIVTCILLPSVDPPATVARAIPAEHARNSPAMEPGGDSLPKTMPAVASAGVAAQSRPVPVADASVSSRISAWWSGLANRVRPWLPEIVLVWLIGVFVAAMRPVLSWRTMRRLRRMGVSAVGEAVEVAITRIALRLKLARTVEVLQSTLVHTPVVLGYFRPVILLPVCVLAGLPVTQLESILAHELAHIRRHDYLVNLLQTLVETLFFYHPAVWWLSRQIRNERENCCDDVAMTLSASRADYGRALLAIEEMRATPTALSLSARGGSLLARIRRIAGHTNVELGVAPSFAVSGSILGAVLASIVIFAAATWGAAPKAEKPATADESQHEEQVNQDNAKPKVQDVRESTKGLTKVGGGTLIISDNNPYSNETGTSKDIIVLPGFELLTHPNVLADLHLTPEQKKGLQEIQKKNETEQAAWYENFAKSNQDMIPAEREIAAAEHYQKQKESLRNQVGTILTAEQSQTLKNMVLLEKAFYRLQSIESLEQLGITDLTKAQKDELLSLRDQVYPRSEKLSQQAKLKMLAVLNLEQRAKFQELMLGPVGFLGFLGRNVEIGGETFIIPSMFPYTDFGAKDVKDKLSLSASQEKRLHEILGNKENLYDRLASELQNLSPQERKKTVANFGNVNGGTVDLSGGANISTEEQKKREAEFFERMRKDREKKFAEWGKNPLVKLGVELRKQFEATLTPDQLAKYKEMAFENVCYGNLCDFLILHEIDATDRQKSAIFQLQRESMENENQSIREMSRKMLNVLTPAQQGKLREAIEQAESANKQEAGKRSTTNGNFIGGAGNVGRASESKSEENPNKESVHPADKPAPPAKKDDGDKPEPAPKKSEQPKQSIEVSGQVLDDETGKPVGQFVVQAGLVDKKDPQKITWGYSETRTSSDNPEGRFSVTIDWGGGWRARIIAAGYLPQPILENGGLPAIATKIDQYFVRLKRGRLIKGRVVYHDGKPAAETAVFMIVKEGGGGVEISDGKAWQSFGPDRTEDQTVTRATTDSAGRFELPGGGLEAKAIAVSAPNVDLWVVPPPKPDDKEDLTIKLPEPGRLVVKYDIDGGAEKAPLMLQMVTWDDPKSQSVDRSSWNGIDNLHSPAVPNRGEVTIDHLAPGKYSLARVMPADGNKFVGRYFNDRREIEIQSGKTATAEYIRNRGTAVEGQVAGLKEGMLAGTQPGAIISVRPVKVTGPLGHPSSMKEPIFDIIVCGLDGKFKTPRLMPGEYAIIAEAFEAEKPSGTFHTGIRLPAFLGRAVVTIQEAGPPPNVTIEIKPRGDEKLPAAAQDHLLPTYNATGYTSGASPSGEPVWKDIQLPNTKFKLFVFDGVLRALNITDEQVGKFHKIQTMNLRESDNFAKGMGRLSDDEQSNAWKQWETEQEKKIEKLVEEILSPEQLRTLDEINARDEEIAKLGGTIYYETGDPGTFNIGFQGSRIDDAGIAHLRGMKRLVSLDLGNTSVTDAGMKSLAGLTNLKTLWIWGTKVTDSGLAPVENLIQLNDLALGGLNITDVGLEHLKGLTELKALYLTATKVTDTGLEKLKGLTHLKRLDLNNTKVTAAGVADLQKSLPQCKIEWKMPAEGDEIKKQENAIATLTTAGAKITYNENQPGKPVFQVNLQRTKISDDDLTPLEDLPELHNLLLGATAIGDAGMKHVAGLKKLGSLALWDTKVTDAGLQNIEAMADLHVLYLNGLNITDAGLDHFKSLKQLEVLGLTDSKVTDAGLEKLKGLSHLQNLDLRNTQVTGAGLEHLQGLRGLTVLVFSGSKITDDGLERLKGMPQLYQIILRETGVTDAGLKHLHGLKELRDLDLSNTKVTAAGVAELQKALPQCKIEWKPATAAQDR